MYAKCIVSLVLPLTLMMVFFFVQGQNVVTATTNDDDNHLEIIIKLQTILAISNAIPKSDMHFSLKLKDSRL